jgi:L-asparaginase
MNSQVIVLANSVAGSGIPAAAAALRAGAPTLDAVEAGIRPVELDLMVDSVGVGGLPNLLGEVELDASIMDGRTLRCGAVGALRGYLHPITVARQVMAQLPHVFLVGAGAARFAAESGAAAGETLTPEATQKREAWLAEIAAATGEPFDPHGPLAPWARATARASGPQSPPPTAGPSVYPLSSAAPRTSGTTVFLARDAHGDIAAGVSTSGWAYKYPGRLGDSPVIGAGCYADNDYGAAACIGQGELTIRAGTARAIVLYMKMGMAVVDACHEAAADLRRLQRDYGGAVTIHAIDRDGNPYVLAVGHSDTDYWIWTGEMGGPETRHAATTGW